MTKALAQLERLPAEVGIMVLKSVPEMDTLFALIAASPTMLRLYSQAKDQISAAVVRNEVGEDLYTHATFLSMYDIGPRWYRHFDPISIRDFTHCISETVNIDHVLMQEHLTRNIIQTCVNDELNEQVELTNDEWWRLRRGFYNFRVAARFSEGESGKVLDILPFCDQCSPEEILEMLYILHCLRNRFAKYLDSLEEAIMADVSKHGIGLRYEAEGSFFSARYKNKQFNWNCNAPWTSNIRELHELCQLPAKWDRRWREDDRATIAREFEPNTILASIIPADHDFKSSMGLGFSWLQQMKSSENHNGYHCAIPLGFMIWDDERLKKMAWIHNAATFRPTDESWRLRYQDYTSFEERVQMVRRMEYIRCEKYPYDQEVKAVEEMIKEVKQEHDRRGYQVWPRTNPDFIKDISQQRI